MHQFHGRARELYALERAFATDRAVLLHALGSMGKTALATNIALNAAMKERKRVLIFSLEMTKEEVIDRITASGIGVPTWKISSSRASSGPSMTYSTKLSPSGSRL